jgi:hypothetical protein
MRESFMTSERLRLGFVGDLGDPCASDLKEHVDLIPFAKHASDLDGVVFDGQSAGSTARLEQHRRHLKAILDSGQLLAVANPTSRQLAKLTALTGAAALAGWAATQPLAFVALRKGRGPDGRVVYDPFIAPIPRITRSVLDGATDSEVSGQQAVSLGATLVQLHGGQTSSADITADTTGTQLIPPAGAQYGYTHLTVIQQAGPLNPPLCNNNQTADDVAAGTNTQSISGGSMLNEWYVYFVNGDSISSNHYYVVILKQTGSFQPGPWLVNNQNSRGYFMPMLSWSNNLADNTGHSFASGLTLLGQSPATMIPAPAEGNEVPVLLSAQMSLNIQGVTQGWTAEVEDQFYLPDWGVVNSPIGLMTGWQLYQVTGWDRLHDSQNWEKTAYSKGQVVSMPDSSWYGISLEAVTAWRFDSSLFAPGGNSLPVSFSGTVAQELSLFHNPSGCTGACGGRGYHWWGTALQTPWGPTTFDLSNVLGHWS